MIDVHLDPEEQQIEDSAEEFVPVDAAEKERVDRIIARARKNRNINIRMTELDLEMLRARAQREGLPYQTLISSVLHRYVNDQLVDERQITKTLELIGKKQAE